MPENEQPLNDLPADPVPPEVTEAVAEVLDAPAEALPPDETIQKAIDEAGEPVVAERPVFKRIGAQSWVEEIDQKTGEIVRRYPQGEEPTP